MTLGSKMVACIEDLWKQAQKIHPDIPDAVVTVGSGVAGYSTPRWGHVVTNMWGTGDVVGADGNLHHFLLSGETFDSGAEQTLATLLHEAAHLVAAERNVKDTSNGGRYHNQKFKKIAEELGLVVGKQDPYGWTDTTLADGTLDLFDVSVVEYLA
jgi:ABC-type Zn uptake system ZnuABC Zn-binding protein ZnuA